MLYFRQMTQSNEGPGRQSTRGTSIRSSTVSGWTSRRLHRFSARWTLAALAILYCAGIYVQHSEAAVTIAHKNVIYLTSGTSWKVPSDWNPKNNTIECIGAGGNGHGGDRAFTGGGGGGGGAYAKISNLSLTRGSSVSLKIAAGGDGGAIDTYF